MHRHAREPRTETRTETETVTREALLGQQGIALIESFVLEMGARHAR
jgi:hypothetical protein